MSTVQVVTGFVPIPNPRSEDTYRQLGAKLLQLPRVKAYEGGVEDCWLWPHVGKAQPAVADNPAKNTLAYHCVQHQKTAWLVQAVKEYTADVLVWIDYGIFHLQGITLSLIEAFLHRVKGEQGISLPGCWSKQVNHNDRQVNWRFCGGVVVIHKRLVTTWHQAVKDVTLDQLALTGLATWEVNNWARAEDRLPIRWYQADHNTTLFTHY